MPIGTSITEKDASLYSRSVSENPCLVVVGTATKGPIGEPTLCISQKDLVAKFGPANSNCLGLYSAIYHLNETVKCYYLRVAHKAPTSESSTDTSNDYAKALISISATSGDSTLTDYVVLEAAEFGTYYNNYKVNITNLTGEGVTAGTFTLSISNSKGSMVETYSPVSLTSTDANYIGKVLKGAFTLKSIKTNAGYTLNNGEVVASGGNDGITGLTSGEYVTAIDSLKSDNIVMDILTVPGVYDRTVVTKGLTVCETRGDSIYIVDTPDGLSYEDAIKWVNGTLPSYTGTAFNSSFGAVYWPWLQITDETSATKINVPPSIAIPSVYARNDKQTHPWYAPAGLTRGLIKNILSAVASPDTEEQNLLYENKINPIITHPSFGLAVFGQKTLVSQSSSLDRINVRRLITHIKTIVKGIAQYLTFEPNDETTWNNFEDLLEPKLESIKTNRGLYDYRIVSGSTIVTDDDIDNYRMPGQVLIKPTKSAEYIPIEFVLATTGTEFNTYNNIYAE